MQTLFNLFATSAVILSRTRLWVRLRREERGQDVIEYALLAAFIGVAGLYVLQTMDSTILNTYSSWIDPSVGAPSLWEPAAPLGSGS